MAIIGGIPHFQTNPYHHFFGKNRMSTVFFVYSCHLFRWLESRYSFTEATNIVDRISQNHNFWLVVWNIFFLTFHILGISSSQLTHIFQAGQNHQPGITIIPICSMVLVYLPTKLGDFVGKLTFTGNYKVGPPFDS